MKKFAHRSSRATENAVAIGTETTIDAGSSLTHLASDHTYSPMLHVDDATHTGAGIVAT